MSANKSILDSSDLYALSGFAEVQKARKLCPYTITLIGDSQALGQWRLAQAAKEIEWQKAEEPKRTARRVNAIAAVEAQDGRKSNENAANDLILLEETKTRHLFKYGSIKTNIAATELYVPKPEPSTVEKLVKWLREKLNRR